MKNYKTWLKAAAIVQFLFAIFHTISIFTSLPPNNETEKQLYSLMENYQFDLGAGFHRTMNELITSFSASLTLLMFFGGAINWYLLRKNTNIDTMKGILNINLIVFGICLIVMAVFTFHIPIIISGLIFIFLLLSRITIQTSKSE